jgi:formylglycine-generating enzyme required for sulfatase activity
LVFPTEAQWEYAARADTPSPAVLDGHANVYDQTRLAVLERQQTRQNGRVADFADGFAELAPIASLHANAFGLHDVLGNVAEWCLDAHVGRGYSTLQPRVGDGLRATVVAAQVRAVRGGSYSDGCDACQPAARAFEAPSKMSNTIGVRPVRRLGKE